MSRSTPKPTLDQLQVFLCVVENGSFSAASRAPNRAQSVVSYTIANLEDQLGVALFHRSGTRRPQLTEAGQSVLKHVRRLMSNLDLMQAHVKALREGLESELSVAIGVLVPSDAVVCALHSFRERYPTVALKVLGGTLGFVVDAVVNDRAVIGFGGAIERTGDLLIIEQIGSSSIVPVAAANHPLAQLDRVLSLADVQNETQIVVADTSGTTRGRDFNVLSLRTWRVSDVATKHSFIKGGLGWGGLPASLVKDDLRDGHLVLLRLPNFGQSGYPIFFISKASNPPGRLQDGSCRNCVLVSPTVCRKSGDVISRAAERQPFSPQRKNGRAARTPRLRPQGRFGAEPIACQTRCGRNGMSMLSMPSGRSGLITALAMAGGAPIAQIVAGSRELGEFGVDVVEVVRPGRAVVHQAAAEHLAAVVAHDLLEHGLPDAPQYLPFADHPVYGD